MHERTLNLVKIPLRADRFAQVARRRGIPLRELDDGYLGHCLLTELWQERAPLPFVMRGRGRAIDIWGYTECDAQMLTEHARSYGDPTLLDAIDGLDSIVSKPMPVFPAGKAVGFTTRVCPVVRLSKAISGHRAGAEVDAFLARAFGAPADETPTRENVYREWLLKQFAQTERSGARVTELRVIGMSRTRLTRRTQGATRVARSLERPDVHIEGELIVEQGSAFLDLLARGLGRHRAFGFGALLVIAPQSARRVQ